MIKWVDSHAHLSTLSQEELLSSCSKLTAVLKVSTDIASSRIVLEQSGVRAPFLMSCAVGISAPEVEEYSGNAWKKELRDLLSEPSVVAIGETGVDGVNRSYPPLQVQKKFFDVHLDFACEFDMPVIIHSRGAEREALAMCLAKKVKKALFHCYTGSVEDAQKIMEAGYYISLSGIITFKNSGLEEVARCIWPERLLIETDSPFLAPEPLRGTKNEPNNVSLVGEKVADLRGESYERMAQQIQKNMETLFGLQL